MNKRSKPGNKQKAAKKRVEKERLPSRRHLDEKLDAALEQTFPASDPVQLEST